MFCAVVGVAAFIAMTGLPHVSSPETASGRTMFSAIHSLSEALLNPGIAAVGAVIAVTYFALQNTGAFLPIYLKRSM